MIGSLVSDRAGAEHMLGEALAYLNSRLPSARWMVVPEGGQAPVVLLFGTLRTDLGQDPQTLLAARFLRDAIERGDPCVVPRTDRARSIAGADGMHGLTVGAYVAAPLIGPDGDRVGVLGSIHPTAFGSTEARLDSALLRFVCPLLARLLVALREQSQGVRLAELNGIGDYTDVESGAFNRTGWLRILKLEEARCCERRLSASLIAIRVKPGNRTQGRAPRDIVRLLNTSARDRDVVARIDTHKYAVLYVGCDEAGIGNVAARTVKLLHERGIDAEIGYFTRPSTGDLHKSWLAAQRAGQVLRPGRLTVLSRLIARARGAAIAGGARC